MTQETIQLKKIFKQIYFFLGGKYQRLILMSLKHFTKNQNYPDIVDLRIAIAQKAKVENKYCF